MRKIHKSKIYNFVGLIVLLLDNSFFFFFFQAEDGIRDGRVMEFRRVLFRSQFRRVQILVRHGGPPGNWEANERAHSRSEERRVGKSVDLGGRRIIKKKKK